MHTDPCGAPRSLRAHIRAHRPDPEQPPGPGGPCRENTHTHKQGSTLFSISFSTHIPPNKSCLSFAFPFALSQF